jgi:hypothetical protein
LVYAKEGEVVEDRKVGQVLLHEFVGDEYVIALPVGDNIPGYFLVGRIEEKRIGLCVIFTKLAGFGNAFSCHPQGYGIELMAEGLYLFFDSFHVFLKRADVINRVPGWRYTDVVAIGFECSEVLHKYKITLNPWMMQRVPLRITSANTSVFPLYSGGAGSP